MNKDHSAPKELWRIFFDNIELGDKLALLLASSSADIASQCFRFVSPAHFGSSFSRRSKGKGSKTHNLSLMGKQNWNYKAQLRVRVYASPSAIPPTDIEPSTQGAHAMLCKNMLVVSWCHITPSLFCNSVVHERKVQQLTALLASSKHIPRKRYCYRPAH